MRIFDFDRCDTLNNPGSDKPAFTIWFAGCSIHCEGCHNQKLWDKDNGKQYDVNEIVDMIISQKMEYEDIILLGGEPLEQDMYELRELCIILYLFGYKVWLYTSCEIDDIPCDIIESCHFIKTGRYEHSLRTDKFPASSNQQIFKRIGSILTKQGVI